MKLRNIFIIGSGYLAKSIVTELSGSGVITHANIFIFSRNFNNSNWLCTIGNVRSSIYMNSVKFHPEIIDWNSSNYLVDKINELRPGLVINTSSLQSMWSLNLKNKWSDLILKTGYGLTLPLQYYIANKVANSISSSVNPPIFINCCYPDCVNYLLKKKGHNIYSGIGNIGIIELVLSGIILKSQEYKMLATHYHVQELMKDEKERIHFPKLFFNGEECQDSSQIFRKITLVNNHFINSITSSHCIKLMDIILNEKSCTLHLPGPNGLIGGFPVTISKGLITLIGAGISSLEKEEIWNRNTLSNEGLVFQEDKVCFSDLTYNSLVKVSHDLAVGFDYADIDYYVDEFIGLKKTLLLFSN